MLVGSKGCRFGVRSLTSNRICVNRWVNLPGPFAFLFNLELESVSFLVA
jgi:hypothetical protein